MDKDKDGAEQPSGSPPGGRYPKTRWSLVANAAGGDEQALDELFGLYWFPVYGAFRDKVWNHHDAEDLVQRFFADMHRRRDLEKVGPDKGLFRAWLKTAVGNMVRNFVDEITAGVRDRGKVVSINEMEAEAWMKREPSHDENPEIIFDRRWIFTILENAKTDLRRDCAEKNKVEFFKVFEDFLIPQARPVPYSQIAEELNQKEGTARVNAHRIRERYRELIKWQILDTVNGSARAEEELGYLSGLVGFDLGDEFGVMDPRN